LKSPILISNNDSFFSNVAVLDAIALKTIPTIIRPLRPRDYLWELDLLSSQSLIAYRGVRSKQLPSPGTVGPSV
jgi:hypothetical protein